MTDCVRMRDGAERARPRRVIVKNIFEINWRANVRQETRDYAGMMEKECGEDCEPWDKNVSNM